MKKTLSVIVLIGLLVGSFAMPADARKKKKKKKAPAAVVKVERQAQGTYAAPATVVGNCTQTDGVGCMTIATAPEEQYVTGKVTDSHGQPVVISVQADLDGDAQSDVVYGVFCGETAEPIKIDPGVSIIFWVSPPTAFVAAAGCTPGIGTQGTLDVTFSNLP